jgi:hypothetical protein
MMTHPRNMNLGRKPLLEDCHIIVERRFASPSDLENYAGGSVSSW